MMAAIFFDLCLPMALVALGFGAVGFASGSPTKFGNRQKHEQL